MQVNYVKVPLIYHGLFKRLFKTTLNLTGNNLNASVVIRFASEEEIKQLNKKFRQVDNVTDVLSFPMLEITSDKKLEQFESEALPNGIIELGDIAVCKQKAKSQARQYGHSYKRELAFLVVHGYLHLLGYDHMTKEDEKVMMNMAENILLNHGLER